jgi:hypothetical protein
VLIARATQPAREKFPSRVVNARPCKREGEKPGGVIAARLSEQRCAEQSPKTP